MRSLAWRLPLFVSLVAATFVVVFLAVSHRQTKRALEVASQDRAGRAASQLADLFADSARQRLTELERTAAHPALVAFAEQPSPATRAAAATVLQAVTESATSQRLEIWSAGARLLLSAETSTGGFPPASPPSTPGSTFVAHDGIAMSDVVAAVTSPTRPRDPPAYLVWRRAIVIRPEPAFLTSLIGDGAVIKMGSTTSRAWTDLTRDVEPPALDLSGGGRGRYRDGGGLTHVGSLSPIRGTGWAIWVGFPYAEVVAPAIATLQQLSIFAALLVAATLVIVRLMTARMSRPLVSLTQAAEAVAGGDYTPVVPSRGRDEIGRLGEAFNAMTTKLAEDVSRRRAAELALLDREASFHALFSANPLPMWVYARESLAFLEVNQAAIEHYGYSRDEFRSMRITDIRPAEDVPLLTEHLGRHRPDAALRRQWRHLTKDGRSIEVDVTSHPLLFDGTNAVLVVSQDVTQRVALEAQLRQAQKMDAIGTLAGGVAHDFNNLLTAILGYADLISEELPADHPAREDLSEVQKAGLSAAALTRQLLAFSRKQIRQPQPMDLNAAIANVESMLRRVIGEHIAFDTKLAPELAPVNADPGQIEQIVMNLVVNARDAMRAGGRLTIETRNVELDARYAEEHVDVHPGAHVLLAVSDSGVGMDEATRAHLFEPFFTTKPRGEGTGLGLATVYGIVKQSGGSIEVYTEPGRGTTFKVYFPRAVAPVARVAKPEPARSLFGTETILVAEDQAEVRTLARAILYRHGYTVIEAANGTEAMEAIRRHDRPIDLLLTDIVMPDMTGPELVARSEFAARGIKVLYTSGYADEAVTRSGVMEPGAAFIQKPYTAPSLLACIRAVLDAG